MIRSSVEFPMIPTTKIKQEMTVLMYLNVCLISLGLAHMGGKGIRGKFFGPVCSVLEAFPAVFSWLGTWPSATLVESRLKREAQLQPVRTSIPSHTSFILCSLLKHWNGWGWVFMRFLCNFLMHLCQKNKNTCVLHNPTEQLMTQHTQDNMHKTRQDVCWEKSFYVCAYVLKENLNVFQLDLSKSYYSYLTQNKIPACDRTVFWTKVTQWKSLPRKYIQQTDSEQDFCHSF